MDTCSSRLNKIRPYTMLMVLFVVLSTSLGLGHWISLTAAPLLESCTPVVSSGLDVSSNYKIPISGYATISQGPISGHSGPESIDFKVKQGTQVVAARDGTVNRLGSTSSSGYGLYVRIDHDDGQKSYYAHLSSYGGKASGRVSAGELIGYSGNTGTSTGEHLHFEVKVSDVSTPIRQIAGVHWFQVEKNGYNAFCNLDYRIGVVNHNDGYAYSSWITDPSITKYDGMPDKCAKIASSNVVLFKYDNCEGDAIPLNTEKFDYTSLPFQPSSIYIGNGWSTIIDDGNGNYLCARRSLWDLTLDYYHPVANKPIDQHINRLYPFKDSTCGGRDTNNDGVLDSGKTLPDYGVGGVGGSNPTPQPGVTPVPPPESNPQDPNQHVVVFLETYYKNVYYELEPGYWDIEDREYRSISAPSGWSYVLVDKDGNQQCFNFSHHNMQDYSEWHVRIDSIAVFNSNVCTSTGQPELEPLGDWFARFWTDKDFWDWGLKIKFTGDERYFWIENLRDGLNPTMNDDIESLEVNSDRAVAVYEHDGLQGGVKCFTSTDSDLWNDQFDNGLTVANQISSIRFFTRSECNMKPNSPIELWVHEAKRGSITITWVKSSPDSDGYHVKMFINGAFQTVATLSEDQARLNAQAIGSDINWIRAWTFTSVTCGENYTFAVSAYNDRAESYNSRQVTAKVECDCNDPIYNGVGLYEHRYCQGESVQLTEPGLYNLSGFDNKASSVFVKPGWSVELYDLTGNVDGLTTCVQETKWDLSYDNFWLKPIAMNDAVSNVKVWNVPNCGRTLPQAGCDNLATTDVTLFDYTHCLGRDKSFGAPGFYLLDDFDDLTSSVFVPEGKSVRLYENQSKEGNYVCVRDTKWDMNYDFYWWDDFTNTFNNISAVEVFDDQMCGGLPKPPIITFPEDNSPIMDDYYMIFRWENIYAGGYWAELWGPNGFFMASGKLHRNEWYVGTLETGEYTFRVLGDVYSVPSDFAVKTFTVTRSEVSPEVSVSYSINPDQANYVTFNVSNCSGEQVHYVFGHDSIEADSPCVDGSSSIEHVYPFNGEAVLYDAVVNGITIQINLFRARDCGELAPMVGVSLFAENDCRGEKRQFSSVGSYTLADFNDQTNAILVAPDWSVEVFENFNSSDGLSYCVTRDIWNASLENYYSTESVKLHNSISNIRVYNDRTCGKEFPQYGGCDANIVFDGVVLFDYIHCSGSERTFDVAGKQELGYGGTFNDLASSIHVGQGWSVLVFDTSGWQGDQRCIAGDMWDFGLDKYWQADSTMNNSISSVEVFHNPTCQVTVAVPTPLAVPTNLQPSGGIFLPNQPVILKWNAVPGAVSYVLEMSTEAEVKIFAPVSPEHTFLPTRVGSYHWRVKAVGSETEGEWSALSLLTVREPEVQTPIAEPEAKPTPVTPVPVTPIPINEQPSIDQFLPSILR